MTVGELRRALDGVPDGTPVRIRVADLGAGADIHDEVGGHALADVPQRWDEWDQPPAEAGRADRVRAFVLKAAHVICGS